MNNNDDTDLAAIKTCIVAFEDARAALDKHYRWCDKVFKGAHNEHGVEARKRVSQMIWLLRQIEPLIAEAAALRTITHSPTPPSSKEGDDWFEFMNTPEMINALQRQSEIVEPLEVLTEAFYWFASRTRFVIRNLPKLEKFEAKGVRNVRNHLLEHPESNSSRVLVTSFAYGGQQGPVVKGLRYDHQAALWPDAGLFVNALEFAVNLKQHINSILLTYT